MTKWETAYTVVIGGEDTDIQVGVIAGDWRVRVGRRLIRGRHGSRSAALSAAEDVAIDLDEAQDGEPAQL